MNAKISASQQSGQAVIEAFVCLLALGVLWVAVAWLGRIQDLALQASNASRHAAFLATRLEQGGPLDTITTGAFYGQANQWMRRDGERLQDSVYQRIDVSFRRSNATTNYNQDVVADPRIIQLGKDWLSVDERVLSAQVSLVPFAGLSRSDVNGSLLGLEQLDNAYPQIQRHTSIMTGAGHSGDDLSAAERIANSNLAWSGPFNQSYGVGRKVNQVASRVDAGWKRPQPVFDWLKPWAEYLPSHHLRPSR